MNILLFLMILPLICFHACVREKQLTPTGEKKVAGAIPFIRKCRLQKILLL
ncbi:MAG: hypothetical protein KAT48_03345 [Bacteroidales bacterium]|nr:hypothetical protein [Bacteroidales bacterium]